MAELAGGDIQHGITRRNFLKALPALSAALVGAATGLKIGQQEATKIREGWFEHDGVRYFPLYEDHKHGPTIMPPDETDALFMESNIRTNEKNYTIYTLPADILAGLLSRHAGKERPGNIQLLDRAKSYKIPIAVGDVRGIPELEVKYSQAQINQPTTLRSGFYDCSAPKRSCPASCFP